MFAMDISYIWAWDTFGASFNHMVEAYVIGAIVYASLFGLMSLGLTLTYLTTKVPNFAYGSFVTVGMYVSYTFNILYKVSAYVSAPAAFLFGGCCSVAMYLIVLRTLAKRGSSLVSLMIATLAVDIGFLGIFGMYTDYFAARYRLVTAKVIYQFPDFDLWGLPGLFYVGPISLAIVSAVLFLLLTRTRFGVSMRASVENPNLARVLGINVERVYTFAWFLAGGFAALSGSYYILWLQGGIDAGSGLIVEIFAASVLGGLASIYGAMLGGLVIGASEVLVTTALVQNIAPWFSLYQKGIPLVIMIITLLILPEGLVSIDWIMVVRRRVSSALDLLESIVRSLRMR